ncbi:hypothetical protein BJ742DRAFT_769368 [Cladochytrium replicatum]|nr:hypothetical protein BJ742DRAFT_769368 [Cladochytrium replicatum]
MGASASALSLSHSPSGSRMDATEQSGFDSRVEAVQGQRYVNPIRLSPSRQSHRRRKPGLQNSRQRVVCESGSTSTSWGATSSPPGFRHSEQHALRRLHLVGIREEQNAMLEFHFVHNEDRSDGDYAAVADCIAKETPQPDQCFPPTTAFPTNAHTGATHELYDPLAQHLSRYNEALEGDPSAQNENWRLEVLRKWGVERFSWSGGVVSAGCVAERRGGPKEI